MFCTLKQNGQADQSYTFETTVPPFSKRREGRLAKIACTKCRISKLKCSGEPNGCQRCIAKKIDCRYPNPARGNSHKKKPPPRTPTHGHGHGQGQAPTPPETPQIQSPSRPHVDLMPITTTMATTAIATAAETTGATTTTFDDDFFTTGHEMMYTNNTNGTTTLDDLDLNLGAFEMARFTTLDDIQGLLSDGGEYMDPAEAMTPWHQMACDDTVHTSSSSSSSSSSSPPWNENENENGNGNGNGGSSSPPDGDEDVFFPDAEYGQTAESPTSGAASASACACACFARAAATFEAVEVAVWLRRQGESARPKTDDVLQSQKTALVECEALLECAACRARSAYVMLLLSVCRLILGTLEELGQAPDPGAEEAGLGPKRRRVGDGEERREAGDGRGYGIRIRNRRLDDDDEYLVLQSLVAARVARLSRLLGSLGKIVGEQGLGSGWAAHKGLVQELQKRILTGSFDVGKARRGWTG